MALGSIVIDMLLKTGSLVTDSKVAERRLEEMGKKAREAGRVIGTALAGALTAAGVAAIAMTRSTVEAADRIERLSQLSGTTSETFQRWAAASQTVGIEQDKLSDILKDMQDRVGDFIQTGGGPMADFFEKIAPRVGLTADAFARLSGPESLQLFVDSLEKAGANANEMVFYMESIASDSTLLLPLLRNNGRALQELGDQAERFGAILDDRTIAASAELRREMIELDQLTTGLRNTIAVELIPAISELTDILSNPETQQAIRDAAGLIGSMGSAAVKATTQIASLISQYKELLADRGLVPGDDLNQLQARRDRMAAMIETSESRPTWLGSPKNIAKMKEELAEIDKMIAEYPFRGVSVSLSSSADDPGIGGAPGRATPAAATSAISKSAQAAADALRESERALDEYTRAQMESEARQLAWMTRIEDATALMEGPASQAVLTLRRSIAEADAALAAGTITIAQHSDYVAAMGHQYGETVAVMDTTTGEMTTFADQAARNIQSTLGDSLYDVLDGNFKGIADSFSDMIKRMLAEAAAAKLLEGLAGWATGYTGAGSGWINAIGSGLSGRRATGGPVYPGGTFLVGENGPEVLRMGNNSGTIVPNNRLASLGGGASPVKVEVINNGQPMQATASQQTMPDGTQLVRVVLNAVAESIGSGTGPINPALRGRFGLREAV